MRKSVKITSVALAVLLAATLLIPLLFEGRIGDLVKREAGAVLRAQLDFEKLDVSLLRHFPRASLDLKGLKLVGEGPFAGDTIVAADRVSVVVDLLSLFGDEGFEVTKLILVRPRLHAWKRTDGSVNWAVVRPAAEEGSYSETEETADEPSSFRLSVRDVRIVGATLRYEDDSTRMRFSAAPVSLRLRGDLAAAQSQLALRLRAGAMHLVSGGMTLLSGAEGELRAVIEADLSRKRFTLADNVLRLNAVEVSLDGWADFSEPDAVATDIEAVCRGVEFKELLSMIPAFYLRDFRSLTAAGELSLSAWIRGRLTKDSVPAFELGVGVKEGRFQYASLPGAVTDIGLDARIANPGGTMDGTTVEIPLFTARMAGNSVRASFSAAHLFSDLRFRAAVAGRADLGAIEQVYPLEKNETLRGIITADLRVTGRRSDLERQRYEALDASGTFVVEGLLARVPGLPDVRIERAAATVTPAAMILGELNLKVGRSDLAANGQLTDYLGYLFGGSTLAGRLYLKSELFDLNEILESLSAADDATSGLAASDPLPTAVVIPRNLDLALSAELRKVLFRKMTLTQIEGGLRIADGTLSLGRLKMNAFDGRMVASGRYATAADPRHPEVDLSLDIAHASFRKTFEELETVQTFVPLFAQTGGSYAMQLDLSSRLDPSMAPELSTLYASGVLSALDIRISHLEAFAKLADALKYEPLRRIEAEEVRIRFSVADGRVKTEPFDLRIAGTTVRLSGTTGLDRSIDYRARISLPKAWTGGVLGTLDVGIGGTFSDPRITLGVKEAAKEALRKLVGDRVRPLADSATLEEALEKRKETLDTLVAGVREQASADVQRQAERLRDEARRAGEKLVMAAEEQKTRLVSGAKNPLAKAAAEKAGEKLVVAAREQAAKLAAEAEAQAARMTGGQK